jgi:Fe-S cluster assembly scaffold protein SufB
MATAEPLFDRWLPSSHIETLSRELEDPPAVRALRSEAARDFRSLPIEPNPVYRGYTNIAGADLSGLIPEVPAHRVPLPEAPASTLRIVHDSSGTRVEMPQALRAAGVTVSTLRELWTEGREGEPLSIAATTSPDKLTSLALALVNRAVRVRVPDRCAVPVRIQDITVLSAPHQWVSVHRRFEAGEQSRVLVSEELYSTREAEEDGQRLYGSTSVVRVGTDAALHYLTLHAPDRRVVGLYQRHGSVSATGRLAWIWSGFGGLRSRLKSLSELPGNGSQVEDLQTFYGQGDQAYDSAVTIRHIGTDTHGQSITRGLYTDDSRGISRGLVRIEKEARKTLSYLSEHAMLLSKGARSDTIPVLEILCRDVKATHSSSVAPVDPEKVFYLESRGFSPSDSIRMIGEGFLSHVLDRAPIERLREHLYPVLAARWDRTPVLWAEDHYPALPPLSVNADVASDEWRFDAKLR